MADQISYLFMRKAHFLPLICQLVGHYRSQGDEVKVVARTNLNKYLSDYGFGDAFTIINHSILASEIGKSKKVLNLVLPHSSSSIEEWNSVQRHKPSSRDLNFSFFSDGYTNVLVSPGFVEQFMRQDATRHPADLLFFDYEGTTHQSHQRGFSRKVVSPTHLEVMASIPRLKEMAYRAAEATAALSSGAPVLLILLRPWGSQSYYRGRHDFTEVPHKISQVIDALIQQATADFGQKPVVILRPDSRDPTIIPDLMRIHREINDVSIHDFSDIWPNSVNMDPFLYHISQKIPDQNIALASLDSTAPLPFIGLSRKFKYYIGAPHKSVRPIFEAEAAQRELRSKIDLLERHIMGISSRIQCRAQRLDDFFLIASV